MIDTTRKIVDDVLDQLVLYGFDDWWYGLSQEVQDRIEDDLRRIVKRHLEKLLGLL